VEFQAGQFVYATFHQSEIPREPHPFTIASAPGGDHLRIVVKRFGDFTSSMMSLRPGCAVWLEGPFGRFCLEGDPVNAQTWIAGGIGITPFLSWARSLERALPVDLYYCTPAAEHAHSRRAVRHRRPLPDLQGHPDPQELARSPERQRHRGREPQRHPRSRLHVRPAGADRQHDQRVVRQRGPITPHPCGMLRFPLTLRGAADRGRARGRGMLTRQRGSGARPSKDGSCTAVSPASRS
jgi:ferredoxin-NADP reductase